MTACCRYHGSDEQFEGVVRDAASDAERGQAPCHPEVFNRLETHYLKSLALEGGHPYA